MKKLIALMEVLNQLQENVGIKIAWNTMSNGKIYGLPAGEQMGTAGIGKEEDYSIYTIPQFSMINKKWLDELGLEVPTTLDELHDALKAFKDNDMAAKVYGAAPGSTIWWYIDELMGDYAEDYVFLPILEGPDGTKNVTVRTGGGPTDEEWEAYKQKLVDTCGMNELLQVYQDAYDRYSEAQ